MYKPGEQPAVSKVMEPFDTPQSWKGAQLLDMGLTALHLCTGDDRR